MTTRHGKKKVKEHPLPVVCKECGTKFPKTSWGSPGYSPYTCQECDADNFPEPVKP